MTEQRVTLAELPAIRRATRRMPPAWGYRPPPATRARARASFRRALALANTLPRPVPVAVTVSPSGDGQIRGQIDIWEAIAES